MLDFKVRTYELKTGHTVVCFTDPQTLKRKRKKLNSKN